VPRRAGRSLFSPPRGCYTVRVPPRLAAFLP